MKVAVWGSGPIYEAALRACLRHEIDVVPVEDCDVLLLANYTRLLKAADRAIPRVGALCFHPSVLPRHRGRDAVYWTVKMNDPVAIPDGDVWDTTPRACEAPSSSVWRRI